MKYDIAMHLYANGIIQKEQYELVSKVLSGVRLSQNELESELEYNKNSSYEFSGYLGSDSDCDLTIKNGKERLRILYEVSGIKFEVTQNKQNNVGLHVKREDCTGYFKDSVKGYYMVDKNENEDEIVIRYYDKEAYDFVRNLDNNIDYLEVDNFEQAGIIPDEEVTLKDVDTISFAKELIAPFTIGKGNFEDYVNSLLHPEQQKVKK